MKRSRYRPANKRAYAQIDKPQRPFDRQVAGQRLGLFRNDLFRLGFDYVNPAGHVEQWRDAVVPGSEGRLHHERMQEHYSCQGIEACSKSRNIALNAVRPRPNESFVRSAPSSRRGVVLQYRYSVGQLQMHVRYFLFEERDRPSR